MRPSPLEKPSSWVVLVRPNGVAWVKGLIPLHCFSSSRCLPLCSAFPDLSQPCAPTHDSSGCLSSPFTLKVRFLLISLQTSQSGSHCFLLLPLISFVLHFRSAVTGYFHLRGSRFSLVLRSSPWASSLGAWIYFLSVTNFSLSFVCLFHACTGWLTVHHT